MQNIFINATAYVYPLRSQQLVNSGPCLLTETLLQNTFIEYFQLTFCLERVYVKINKTVIDMILNMDNTLDI